MLIIGFIFGYWISDAIILPDPRFLKDEHIRRIIEDGTHLCLPGKYPNFDIMIFQRDIRSKVKGFMIGTFGIQFFILISVFFLFDDMFQNEFGYFTSIRSESIFLDSKSHIKSSRSSNKPISRNELSNVPNAKPNSGSIK
jgi:hypothetical protein